MNSNIKKRVYFADLVVLNNRLAKTRKTVSPDNNGKQSFISLLLLMSAFFTALSGLLNKSETVLLDLTGIRILL